MTGMPSFSKNIFNPQLMGLCTNYLGRQYTAICLPYIRHKSLWIMYILLLYIFIFICL